MLLLLERIVVSNIDPNITPTVCRFFKEKKANFLKCLFNLIAHVINSSQKATFIFILSLKFL